MRPALSVRRVDSRAEFSRRVPLSLRRDAEALVDPPATRRELFASAYRHLAGEPGCAIGGLEVVSLCHAAGALRPRDVVHGGGDYRSEEHTSELQSHSDLVCRLLLEKKKRESIRRYHNLRRARRREAS